MKAKSGTQKSLVSPEALEAAYEQVKRVWRQDDLPMLQAFSEPLPDTMTGTEILAFRRAQIRAFKRQGPDVAAIKTDIPAIDRALPWIASPYSDGGIVENDPEIEPEFFQGGRIRNAVMLLGDMIRLQKEAQAGLPADFADRIRRAKKAQKHLEDAAALFRDIPGSDHLADLCSDLVMGAPLAQGADVRVRARNPETGHLGDAERVRLTCFACHEKTPLSTLMWYAKSGGRAGRDAQAAANGAAVHRLEHYICKNAPKRSAIIAGLCGAVGYDVTSQSVRRILDPATAKPASTDTSSKAMAFLDRIPRE